VATQSPATPGVLSREYLHDGRKIYRLGAIIISAMGKGGGRSWGGRQPERGHKRGQGSWGRFTKAEKGKCRCAFFESHITWKYRVLFFDLLIPRRARPKPNFSTRRQVGAVRVTRMGREVQYFTWDFDAETCRLPRRHGARGVLILGRWNFYAPPKHHDRSKMAASGWIWGWVKCC